MQALPAFRSRSHSLPPCARCALPPTRSLFALTRNCSQDQHPLQPHPRDERRRGIPGFAAPVRGFALGYNRLVACAGPGTTLSCLRIGGIYPDSFASGLSQQGGHVMADEFLTPRSVKEPSYADAIIPAVTLIVLIAGAVFLFGLDALDGPVQVALILCDFVVAVIILKNGHRWEDISKSAQTAMASVTTPFFILFGIGALIGTWNMSGTIPTMVYYGIHLLH